MFTHIHTYTHIHIFRSYLPSNRNSAESERIENVPLAILISTEQFKFMLVLRSSEEKVHRFGAVLSTVYLHVTLPTDWHNDTHIIYIYIYIYISLAQWLVCTIGPGDQNSIPGRVISMIQKWYLMPLSLTHTIIRYGSRVSWANPGKE